MCVRFRLSIDLNFNLCVFRANVSLALELNFMPIFILLPCDRGSKYGLSHRKLFTRTDHIYELNYLCFYVSSKFEPSAWFLSERKCFVVR